MSVTGLIRGFARVGSEGRVALPRNILVAMNLKEKDTIELKITGASKSKKIVISKCQSYR